MKTLRTLFIVLIASCLCCKSTDKNQIQGIVTSISDGDTFILLTENKHQEKVRLYGIDCPEKGQAFGNAAKQTLSELIFNKEVKVRVKGKDDYKRILGITYVGDINVNEEMLKKGMAWHFKRYDKSAAFSQLERDARSSKIGLWTDPYPVAPWEWRRNRR